MNRKVIYILSEYFAPFQNIGSIKFTKVAKYLSEDNDIYVFTRKNKNLKDVLLEQDLCFMKANGAKIYYVNEGYQYYLGNIKFSRYLLSLIDLIKQQLLGRERYYYEKNQLSSHRFVKKSLKILDREKIPEPDLVISTYDDWGGHYLADKIKDLYPKTIWIANFRDPVGASLKSEKYRKLCDDYTQYVSKKADYITTVSKDGLKNIKFDDHVKRSVVTNGFDYPDYFFTLQQLKGSIEYTKKLRFVYTGSFYGSSMLPFFKAIKELVTDNKIDLECLEFVYAGAYTGKLFKEVECVGLQDIFINKGFLKRIDAIALQETADVLVTSVWNRKDSQGVIGGKILSYLMLEKPIVAIVMGDVPNSELKVLMNKIKCGFCYEEANHSFDYSSLKDFIVDVYQCKKQNIPFSVSYDKNELEKFNLKNIANQYIEIFNSLK